MISRKVGNFGSNGKWGDRNNGNGTHCIRRKQKENIWMVVGDTYHSCSQKWAVFHFEKCGSWLTNGGDHNHVGKNSNIRKYQFFSLIVPTRVWFYYLTKIELVFDTTVNVYFIQLKFKLCSYQEG